MDVSLSDLLVCPRCGPTYGLVLLPYDAEDRRVRSGVLGCANCRERFPIEGGVADLRAGRVSGVEAAEPGAAVSSPGGARAGSESEPEPVRLAGLMGLADAQGTVLLAGPAVAHAGDLSALVAGVEVVAVVDEPAPSGPATASARPGGVSRMRIADVFPFRTGSLRGVALTGVRAAQLEEGARALGGEGRLVLDPAPPSARARLEKVGLRVAAEEGGVVVAARSP